MYTFTPMSDEEIDSIGLLEPGIYDFEVAKSVSRISKSGNPMAELTLNVWDKNGAQRGVFDYLVFSQIPMNIRKVKHFCDAVGLEEQYKKGELPSELERFSGKVQINIQDETPKPSGGMYPRKNIVVDYVKRDADATDKVPTKEFSDDLPF